MHVWVNRGRDETTAAVFSVLHRIQEGSGYEKTVTVVRSFYQRSRMRAEGDLERRALSTVLCRPGQAALMALTMDWIGPLCLLTRVALYVSLGFGIAAGSTASLALWGLGTYASVVLPDAAGAGGEVPGREAALGKLVAIAATRTLVVDVALVVCGLVLITLAILRTSRLDTVVDPSR